MSGRNLPTTAIGKYPVKLERAGLAARRPHAVKFLSQQPIHMENFPYTLLIRPR